MQNRIMPSETPSCAMNHYENFPVASVLSPRKYRRQIALVYHFARGADDIADEGVATAPERLAELAAWRQQLQRSVASVPDPAGPKPALFLPLGAMIRENALPVSLFEDLLDAFSQDCTQERYADYGQVLDYCRRSANPVGRILLYLYGHAKPENLQQSDAICSALQLINFWQDLSRDIPNRRIYLPLADCEPLNLTFERMQALATGAQPRSDELKIIARKSMNSETKMQFGSKIVHQVPGRAGWELRGVVQGGLAILRGMERINFNTWHHRPTVGKRHVPGLVWRALWM